MNASITFDREPPLSVEAEQSVLGAVMFDPDCLFRAPLAVDDFSQWPHRAIWQAIKRLELHNLPIDVMTVFGVLEESNEAEGVGGLAYLGSLTQNTPSSANVHRYAEIVADRAAERRLLAASHDLAELAVARDGRTVAEKQAAALALVGRVATDATAEGQTMKMGDAAKLAIAAMQARMEREEDSLGGLTTGLKRLDAALDGLREGDLLVVGGRPSIGKSVLGEALARAVAKSNLPVRFHSYEMPAKDLALRQLSAGSGVPLTKLRTARGLEDEDYHRFTVFACEQNEYPIWIDNDSSASVDQICLRARQQHRRSGLSLLVVDHLHLMPIRGDNPAVALGEITKALKGLATSLQIPVVLLAQLNRETARSGGRRPTLSDLRASGNIEQDADVVILVHREGYYDDQANPHEAELIIAKHRNGEVGTVRVGWNPECVRFEDAPPTWIPSKKPAQHWSDL